MTPMQTLLAAGLTLSTEGDRLYVGPSSSLTDPLRALIREHKPELWAAVREAETVATNLIEAINRCCDERRDDAQNRADLIKECSQLTPHLQADALDHFRTEAERWQRANRGQAP
jgi:uncharacterized protein (DUF4415 family)